MNILRHQWKNMIKAVNVMPEFESTGLWDHESKIMVSFEDLKVPPDIRHMLSEWIEYYDNSFDEDYITFKPFRTNALNGWGRRIAIALKKELPTIDVYYIGEDESGTHEPEFIKTEEK